MTTKAELNIIFNTQSSVHYLFWLHIYTVALLKALILFFICRQIEELDKELNSLTNTKESLLSKVHVNTNQYNSRINLLIHRSASYLFNWG